MEGVVEYRLGELPWRVRWIAARGLARIGLPWVAAAVAACALALAGFYWASTQRSRQLAEEASVALRVPSVPAATPWTSDARARLKAFDEHLPAHEDITDTLQRLIVLAERHDLVLVRGNYRAQPEPRGGYLRYRMTLPVSGSAESVHRFMLAALQEHRSLALESVQFKRERSDSTALEARIQWSLLTRPLRSVDAGPGATP